MTAPLKTIENTGETAAAMRDTMIALGCQAKAAARVLALASTAQKDRALAAMAAAIRASRADILAANADDMADGKASGLTSAALDRLALTSASRPWPKGSTWCAPSPTRSARSPSPGRGPTA
jgi:glutamate-5-semialdehyde dehydrogenase